MARIANAVLLLLAGTTFACDPGAVRHRVEFDSAHGLSANVFRPAESGPHPGVLLLHGGCFLHGSSDGLVSEARDLADQGFVAMTIDYRLANAGGHFPEAIRDAKCAVRWLKSHAGDFDLDPGRVAVFGTSAGGYLAAMLGATADLPEFDRTSCGADVDASVEAVVVLAGVSDWRTRCRSGMRTCEEIFLGATCDPRALAPVFREASVVTYRDRVTVPHLLLHGVKDRDIPITQSVLLREALRSHGVDVEFHAIPGARHNFEREWDAPSAREARRTITSFLRERLR